MADAMKPEGNATGKNERLKRLAKICKKGGEYKVAAKLYL